MTSQLNKCASCIMTLLSYSLKQLNKDYYVHLEAINKNKNKYATISQLDRENFCMYLSKFVYIRNLKKNNSFGGPSSHAIIIRVQLIKNLSGLDD